MNVPRLRIQPMGSLQKQASQPILDCIMDIRYAELRLEKPKRMLITVEIKHHHLHGLNIFECQKPFPIQL